MKKAIIIFTIFVFGITGLNAQQLPLINQYLMAPSIFNPAKVVNDTVVRSFLFNRQQWVGIQGSPQTTVLGVDGAISGKKIGLGLHFINDADNIFNRSALYATYAYNFKISTVQNLSIGMTAGIMNVNVKFNNIVADDNDMLLLSRSVNKAALDFTAGVNYSYKAFEAGFVAYHVTGTHFYFEQPENNLTTSYRLLQHFAGIFSYRFEKKEYTIKPVLILRSTRGIPLQADFSVTGLYRNLLWGSAGWRQNSALYVTLGVMPASNLGVGISYEYTTSDIGMFSGPTYEIGINYFIGKRNKHSVYSASGTANEDYSSLEEIARRQSERIDELEVKNNTLKQQLEHQQKEITKLKEEIKRLKTISSFTQEDSVELESFISEHEVKNFDEPDEATTGFNKAQYCVIVGAYKKLQNAKLGQKILKRELNLQTYIIKKPGSKFYFITTDFFDNLKDVKAEYKRLKALHIENYVYGNVWVYKAE